MTKEQLISLIKDLNLSQELETLLLQTVNEKELTPELSNDIADIIEMQAKLHEEEADAFMAEAQIYNELADQLDEVDAEENDQLNKILEEAKQKLEALKTEQVASQEAPKAKEDLAKARETIQAATTPPPAPTG